MTEINFSKYKLRHHKIVLGTKFFPVLWCIILSVSVNKQILSVPFTSSKKQVLEPKNLKTIDT